MQAKKIEASRLEYFDRQKAMYDRVRTELVDRYWEHPTFYSIERGKHSVLV